jgi:hypothetical protein
VGEVHPLLQFFLATAEMVEGAQAVTLLTSLVQLIQVEAVEVQEPTVLIEVHSEGPELLLSST